MNPDNTGDPPANRTHERHAWRAHFLTRFNRYKNQLLNRWWLPLAGIVIGLSCVLAVSRFENPLYLSCGRMIVNLKLSIPEGSLYTEELNNFLGTQAALMQSGLVVQRAQAHTGELLPELEIQPVTLKALIQPKTTIFVLQGTGPDSRYTQHFVQACMEEYINLKKEMRAQTSDNTLAGMTEEVARLEKELRRCDEALVSFQSSNSVLLLQEQGSSAGSYLAGLTQRLAALKSEYALLQALDLEQNLEREQRLAANPALLSSGSEAAPQPQLAGLADSDYLRARQQLLLLKAEQEDLGQYLRPKHPKILALTDDIARRERLLAIFREQTAQQLESRKASLQLHIRNLEQDVREWDVRALELSRQSAEFQRLKANSQRTQALYDRLLATMRTLDVNKQISPESVTIMEPASPALANRPGLLHRLLFGALAGLAASVLLLMILERLDDRISSISELQELFAEELLGQIPRERSALRKGEPGLLQPHDERYAFVEAYRNLRSSLLYMTEAQQRPRTILVTSSVPNDGKSLTAANLAITLAGAGAKVLLVDADLRKGSLHNRFGLALGVPGLSEALGKEAEPAESDTLPSTSRQSSVMPSAAASNTVVIDKPRTALPDWASTVQPTRIPNLDLMPRGQTTHDSSELFLSPVTVRFLDEAGGDYDFVILDTAPVMAADDVTSLAPHVDGVIFVVRAEHSSARVARAALDLLYLRHVHILGLVFNAVRPASADYYYYYKYKDYHHSYPAPQAK